MAYRRIVPLLVAGFVLMLVSLGDRPAQAEHSLSFPFASLDGWYVQQGYDQGSHSGYERYALDLSRDPDPTNTVVLAPASGTVAWIDPGYGCLSLSLGHDGLHLSICHLKLVPAFATGESVAAGQIIGAVAPAGEAGNNGMPHVHMALYRCIDDTCASSAAGREPVPFAGEHALSGVSFEAGDDHTSKLLAALVADPSVAPEAGIDADPAAPSTSAGELAYPPQELLAGVNPIIYFGPALPPKQAFGNLGDAYVAAFAWDAASQRWLIDVPLLAGEGALTHVQPFGAYWIVTSAPATLEPQSFDEPVPSAIPLYPGGNLIAFPWGDRDATFVGAWLGDTLTLALGWNAETGAWDAYLPAAPQASTLTSFEQFGVYWIVMTEGVDLALN